jgi:hypothetical protein
MSEIEELEYNRAAFQILSSILGKLVPDFWKTSSITQWPFSRVRREGIDDRRVILRGALLVPIVMASAAALLGLMSWNRTPQSHGARVSANICDY